MSEIIAFPLPSGPNYTIPDVGDENWGQNVTNLLVALPAGIPPTAGTFTLTGDLSFGSSFGLISKYLTSTTVNPATVGFLRLAKTDVLSWRNNANSANLPLGIDAFNNLTFNGLTIQFDGTVNAGTANQLAYYPASSNAVSGLTSITANKALQSNASGLPVASTTTDTELGYVSGVTSAIQTQIDSATASIATKVSSVSGTANQITSTGGTTPVLAIANPVTFPGAMTAGGILSMASNKITSLSNGTAATDAAAFGQIKVIQFTAGTTQTATTTANAAFQPTSLTASITPTSASNTVLIYAVGVLSVDTGGAVTAAGATLVRNNSINILAAAGQGLTKGQGAGGAGPTAATCTLMFIDAPATTSPTTYTVYIRNDTGNGNTVGWGSQATQTQYMVLVEVIA